MSEARTLKLKDIPWVYRVARQSGLRDPLFARTQAFSPVELAVLSMFAGIGAGTFTFVISGGDGEAGRGVVQVRHRSGRPEADVVFLAPHPGEERGRDTLLALIAHASAQMRWEGIVRLYARLPTDRASMELFRQAGFSLYARETILELLPGKVLQRADTSGVEIVSGCSGWHLWKLYSSITPPLVQWADGAATGEPPHGWDCLRGQVVSWQEEGVLLGAISLFPCRKGCLMRILLQEPLRPEAEDFLRAGIAMLRPTCHRRLYVPVRSYQAGLQRALMDIGFEPVEEFISAVQYIALRQRVPERAMQAVESGERVIAGLSPSHLNMSFDGEEEQPAPRSTAGVR